MEMGDEVLSSVGAQDLDTSSYQVSSLEDIEFNCRNSQLDMDAVFRPGIENSPPAPLTPVSVRPTKTPRLQRNRAFGAGKENVPDYVYINLFQ